MAHETTESSQPPEISALFLQRDGEWWDAGMLFALVVAGLVALIVALFTYGSIKAHKREAAVSDKELADYKNAADQRMIDAREEIAKAQARAAEANARAEEARSEANQANLKLEETKLKLNQLQSVDLYPKERIDRLIVALREISPKSEYVIPAFESNNTEAQHRAYQLVEAFSKAGFKRALGSGASDEFKSRNDKGEIIIINYSDETEDESEKILTAFRSVGFESSKKRRPLDPQPMIADVQKPFIYVMVLGRVYGKF